MTTQTLVSTAGKQKRNVFLTLGCAAHHACLLLLQLCLTTSKNRGNNQTLNLRGLGVGTNILPPFLTAVLLRDRASHDILRHGLGGEPKQLTNLIRPFRAQTQRHGDVRDPGDVLLPFLGDRQREGGQIPPEDTPADAASSALPFPGAPLLEPHGAGLEQQAHAACGHHPLLHREPVLVLAPGDAEFVPRKGLVEDVALHLLPHAVVGEVGFAQVVVLDVNALGAAGGGIRDEEFHGKKRW
mmetsp:Transcript_20089/g.27701  ORF Transcript_20089/g.27701 Transcript_20089/m.27701 type:complete len:241 (-) Transcript_20089:40-762(-)